MFKEFGALMSLMGNKGKIQEEVGKFQAYVTQLVAEGTAGGDMVFVKANGKMEIISVRIAEHAHQSTDREMLEDLIVAATNQAMARIREQLAAKSNEMATNMGLPAGMLGGLGLPGLG